jgi:enolase
MIAIKNIGFRSVLNSHAEFTTEFIIELEDGSIGIGAPPKGETISIYEDKKILVNPPIIVQTLTIDGVIGKRFNQETLDEYLQGKIEDFGRNNVFGLSLAFFNASALQITYRQLFNRENVELYPPYLCLNILNGGRYAYTNPVLSDFAEYMLVAKSNNIQEVIEKHNAIQIKIKEKLANKPKTTVAGNIVSCFKTRDNRECIDFLISVCDEMGLTDDFELMIDASAGDLWVDNKYFLQITENKIYSIYDFYDYWIKLITQYDLRFLEDPYFEKDWESWKNLTTSQSTCYVIGDNFYSSDKKRIEQGAMEQYSHGVVIKPNQAGTVTAVKQAIETAHRVGQIVITSHRSISTEETFLSILTCMYGVKYIKIGPLFSDYSSIVRLNEIIRQTEMH